METKLEKWLFEAWDKKADGEFPLAPNQESYADRYKNFSTYMKTKVHNNVNIGSTMNDGGVLTDHGIDHINTVIFRASCLLEGSNENFGKLTGFEIYLLLCAIHLHDAGNLFGRKGHEKKGGQFLKPAQELLGKNTPEIRLINQIARAHGGEINGDKDTINSLDLDTTISNSTVRPRLLAAILRFADELADDIHRTPEFFHEQDMLPRQNEVFHKYAKSLHSVSVKSAQKSIDLDYNLAPKLCKHKLGKNDSEIYLLDEIFERVYKMFTEMLYCNRFMRPLISIETINVDIHIENPNDEFGDPLHKIKFRLEEVGYPDFKTKSIPELCDVMFDNQIQPSISGENLANKLLDELDGEGND